MLFEVNNLKDKATSRGKKKTLNIHRLALNETINWAPQAPRTKSPDKNGTRVWVKPIPGAFLNSDCTHSSAAGGVNRLSNGSAVFTCPLL